MALPTETGQEFAQSVELAVRLTDENPRAVETFNIYTPYPGTPLYEVSLEQGLSPPQRLEDWARFNFRNLPREYMKHLDARWPIETKMIKALGLFGRQD